MTKNQPARTLGRAGEVPEYFRLDRTWHIARDPDPPPRRVGYQRVPQIRSLCNHWTVDRDTWITITREAPDATETCSTCLLRLYAAAGA